MNKLMKINELAKRLKNELTWDSNPTWSQLVSIAGKLVNNQSKVEKLFSNEKIEWKNFILNSNAIQTQTDSSFLIKLPNNDWCFWVSKKQVRFSGKNNYKMEIGIHKDRTIFRAKRGTKTVKDEVNGEYLWKLLASKEKIKKVKNEIKEEVKEVLTPAQEKIKEENHLKSMAAFEVVAKLKKGVKVKHAKFGLGVIKKATKSILTIDFANGEQKVMKSFVELA